MEQLLKIFMFPHGLFKSIDYIIQDFPECTIVNTLYLRTSYYGLKIFMFPHGLFNRIDYTIQDFPECSKYLISWIDIINKV